MSAPEPGKPRSHDLASLAGTAGLIAATGAAVFLTTLLALHVLRPDLGVASDYVSDYANGPDGGLFTVALYAHGLGNLSLATGLLVALPRSGLTLIGSILLGIAAIGVLLAATFPTDPLGAQPTTAGTIHRATATGAFPVEILALVLLAAAFRSAPGWMRWPRPTLQTAGLAAASLTWFAIAVASDGAPGIPERILLVTLAIWELRVSLRLFAFRDTRARVAAA